MPARNHCRLRIGALLALLLAVAGGGRGQSVISARAGLLNHTEGCVLVDGKHVEVEPSRLIHLHPQQRLQTDDGHAELMLGPAVFLRLGWESQLEMLSTELTAPQVRLLKGSALIDADGLVDQEPVSILVGGTEVRLVKKGLYRIDKSAEHAAAVAVWQGQAVVLSESRKKTILEKHEVLLGGPGDLVSRKVERSKKDPLEEWSSERASEIAQLNGELLRKQAEEDRRREGFQLPDSWGILKP